MAKIQALKYVVLYIFFIKYLDIFTSQWIDNCIVIGLVFVNLFPFALFYFVYVHFFLYILFPFLEMLYACISGCPATHDPPASASQVL